MEQSDGEGKGGCLKFDEGKSGRSWGGEGGWEAARVGSFTVLIKYLPQAGANTFLRGFDPVLLARVRYLIISANFGSEKYLRWDLRLGPREFEQPLPSHPIRDLRRLR